MHVTEVIMHKRVSEGVITPPPPKDIIIIIEEGIWSIETYPLFDSDLFKIFK